MVRPILKYGEPILEQSADPVTEFDTPDLRQTIDDMWETMYAAKGVGLAAPQIGVNTAHLRHRYERWRRRDEKDRHH